jgi:hypothetical protein
MLDIAKLRRGGWAMSRVLESGEREERMPSKERIIMLGAVGHLLRCLKGLCWLSYWLQIF